MAYTPINWTNVTGIDGLLQVPNLATGGWTYFGLSILIFIVGLIISTAISGAMEASLLVMAFLMIVITLPLAYAGLVAYWVVGVYFALLIFIAIYMFFTSKNQQ